MKKQLLAASLLLMTAFVNAQYLVSATELLSKNGSQIKNILNYWGWETDTMTFNGAVMYKITYNTTDVFGEPTVASGALFVPLISCDTLPFVSHQHGTVFEKIAVPSNTYGYTHGLLFSGNGFIVTMPDYLGLGDNPGLHPYIHWESEATASIDLIRAAREFLTDPLQIWDNNQLFLTGFSQGGHSTMAIHKYIKVNNLQSEFNVVASAPMSGPYALSSANFDFVFGSPTYPKPAYLPYACASYQYVYGNLYTSYDEYYDPPYATTIADWIAAGTDPPYLPTNFYAFMQDSVIDNILSMPNHPTRVALRDNDLYNWIPQNPVRMLYCTMDHLVTFENSIVALDTMNALGAPDVQAIDVYPSGNHFTCFIPATTYSLVWFDSLRVECVITSIASVKKQPEINLYPNPVKDIA
ncbi:MAG: hypothetical protein KAK04_08400, partial [Cyclobacteriaceae bacterium]|nr:hypothetical protein [Cyclobacteriaceae bacterium]